MSASPSPSCGMGVSVNAKHDSATIPTGRCASTTCRFANSRLARIDDDGTGGEVSGARSLAPVLPIDVADLTAEWFSAVLQREVHDAELLDRSSGTTGRAHVALAGEPIGRASCRERVSRLWLPRH